MISFITYGDSFLYSMLTLDWIRSLDFMLQNQGKKYYGNSKKCCMLTCDIVCSSYSLLKTNSIELSFLTLQTLWTHSITWKSCPFRKVISYSYIRVKNIENRYYLISGEQLTLAFKHLLTAGLSILTVLLLRAYS